MDSAEEPALDLRKIRLDQALQPNQESLPSFTFCFSPSVRCPSAVSDGPLDTIVPSAVTRRVVAASLTRAGKPTRPFKAYPKNPLSLTMKSPATQALDQSSKKAYLEFRQGILLQIASAAHAKEKRSSSPCSVTSASGGEQEDSKGTNYWERRRKNNEAAKRSRDARRAKEDEIAIRAAFLEQENLKLKYRVVALTNELNRLRYLMYAQ